MNHINNWIIDGKIITQPTTTTNETIEFTITTPEENIPITITLETKDITEQLKKTLIEKDKIIRIYARIEENNKIIMTDYEHINKIGLNNILIEGIITKQPQQQKITEDETKYAITIISNTNNKKITIPIHYATKANITELLQKNRKIAVTGEITKINNILTINAQHIEFKEKEK